VRCFSGCVRYCVTSATLPSCRRPKKAFEAEGACLERALTMCLSDRETALKDLADAARRVDKAAFGHQGDFGQAHQALLKALDRAADFIRN